MSVLNGNAPKSNTRRVNKLHFKMCDWALEAAEKHQLTPPEAQLLFLLAYRADEDCRCFPEVNSLARNMRFSKRHVFRQLDKLEERHLIRRERCRDWRGYQTANSYFLTGYLHDTGVTQAERKQGDMGVTQDRRQGDTGVTHQGDNGVTQRIGTTSVRELPEEKELPGSPTGDIDRDSFKGPVEDTGQPDLALRPNLSAKPTGPNHVNGGSALDADEVGVRGPDGYYHLPDGRYYFTDYKGRKMWVSEGGPESGAEIPF
jgi:hypothetical protein